jgi:hypothetical protein
MRAVHTGELVSSGSQQGSPADTPWRLQDCPRARPEAPRNLVILPIASRYLLAPAGRSLGPLTLGPEGRTASSP